MFSWNLSSWRSILSPDYKLRRYRKLLRSGPVLLQENKWSGNEVETVHQQLPGTRVVQSAATSTARDRHSGWVAILLPPGWHAVGELELVKGRAVAALVQDRSCCFYFLSVYIHPEEQKRDIEAILRAWRFIHKKSDKVFMAGDCNNVDRDQPLLWDRFLHTFGCSDVNPELATYVHNAGVSMLDRCLTPDTLVGAAKLHPVVSTLHAHASHGHKILKLKMMVKPTDLNNPRHPKHEVIPSGVFMSGKDGAPAQSVSGLQELFGYCIESTVDCFPPVMWLPSAVLTLMLAPLTFNWQD